MVSNLTYRISKGHHICVRCHLLGGQSEPYLARCSSSRRLCKAQLAMPLVTRLLHVEMDSAHSVVQPRDSTNLQWRECVILQPRQHTYFSRHNCCISSIAKLANQLVSSQKSTSWRLEPSCHSCCCGCNQMHYTHCIVQAAPPAMALAGSKGCLRCFSSPLPIAQSQGKLPQMQLSASSSLGTTCDQPAAALGSTARVLAAGSAPGTAGNPCAAGLC